MDKKQLNNEIILCRPAVRKARVAVIRKLLRKMKILKACKIEAVREKKLKKSERLFKRIQIMKRVKDDDVTKFALRSKDLEDFLKGSKVNLRQSAMAHLAKHEAVMKKIKSIKERIPNWEVEISVMLDSFRKKKKKKNTGILKTDLRNGQPCGSLEGENEDSEAKKKIKKNEVTLRKGTPERRKIKLTKSTPKKNEIFSDDKEQSDENTKGDTNSTNPLGEHVVKIEKIDDPFFIEKKVVAPKLVTEGLYNRKNKYEVEKSENSRMKDINNSWFSKKSFKSKEKSCELKIQKFCPESKGEKEELHPSWAAKKVQLIKPFEGTKIKFSDD